MTAKSENLLNPLLDFHPLVYGLSAFALVWMTLIGIELSPTSKENRIILVDEASTTINIDTKKTNPEQPKKEIPAVIPVVHKKEDKVKKKTPTKKSKRPLTTTKLAEMADEAFKQGDVFLAKSLYEKVLEKADSRNRLRYTLAYKRILKRIDQEQGLIVAESFYKEKKYRAALDVIASISEDSPEYARAEKLKTSIKNILGMQKANKLYSEGNINDALTLLNNLSTDERNSLISKITLIQKHQNNKNKAFIALKLDTAKKHLSDILKIEANPEHPIHIDTKKELKYLNNPSELAKIFLHKGSEAEAKNNFKKAMGMYEAALQYDKKLASQKVNALNDHFKLLYSKALKSEKTRPALTFYAMKELISILPDNSVLKKNAEVQAKRLEGKVKKFEL